MNKTQIFKTIKSLEGFNKSIEHDSFEKSKKNTDKPFQKYEFLGDRVLGLVISEYLITTFSHNTLDEISRRFIHLVNTNTLAKIFRKNNLGDIFKHQLDPNSIKNSLIKAAYNVKETRDYLPQSATEQVNNLLNESISC